MTTTAVEATELELMQLCNSIKEQISFFINASTDSPNTDAEILELEAKTLNDITGYLKQTLYAKAVLKCRQHNALSPLFRLPTEVLATILTYDLASAIHRPTYFSRLHSLAQVSYVWRNTIVHHPPFWSYIYASASRPWIQTALKNSLAHPLHIKLENQSKKRTGGFFSSIDPHLARCKSLIVDYEYFYRYLRGHLARQIPNLERLSISFLHHPPKTTLDILDGGQGEQIRHISLRRCPLRWTTSIFVNLLSLKLRSIEDCGPSFHQLFEVLQSSPHLCSLDLDDISFHGNGSALGTIELHSLSTIKIGVGRVETLQAIMGMVDAPNCESLELRFDTNADGMDGKLEWFTAKMEHWQPVLRTLIGFASDISVKLLPSSFQIVTRRDGDRMGVTALLLRVGLSYAFHILGLIHEATSPSGISHLVTMEVSGACYYKMPYNSGRGIIRRLFSCFSSTTSLVILDDPTAVIHLLNKVQLKHQDEFWAMTWPLANLILLYVKVAPDDTRIAEALQTVLQSRYGIDPAVGNNGMKHKVGSPTALHGLTMEGRLRHDFTLLRDLDEIKSIVGDEKVFIDVLFDDRR